LQLLVKAVVSLELIFILSVMSDKTAQICFSSVTAFYVLFRILCAVCCHCL